MHLNFCILFLAVYRLILILMLMLMLITIENCSLLYIAYLCWQKLNVS